MKFKLCPTSASASVHAYNERFVYVADTCNHVIRKIDLQMQQISTLARTSNMKDEYKISDPSCDTVGMYESRDVKGTKIPLI